MADRVVGDFASDISAPFNDQPAGDRLTTSLQATAAAPIQVPSVSITAAALRQKSYQSLPLRRRVRPVGSTVATLALSRESIRVLALPAPAIDAHFFEPAFGFPAEFRFG